MIRESRAERAMQGLNVLVLLLLTLTFLLPFAVVVSTSISSAAEMDRLGISYTVLPRGFSLRVYSDVLDGHSTLWPAYRITLFRVIVGTFLSLVVTVMLAYGLSKPNMPGRTFFIGMIFFTMLFGGGLIPTYIVVRGLGLLNTVWVLVIPGMVTVWNFLVMKNFFTTAVPESLEEAAVVDGASPPVVLLFVVIPVSLPVIATVGLFCAVGHWNAWFDAAIYINRRELYPVQILLRNLLQSTVAQDLNPELLALYENAALPPTSAYQSAVIIISTLPILVAYPFVQKYFVKGVLIGSVKG